jgi:hypothetical protein
MAHKILQFNAKGLSLHSAEVKNLIFEKDLEIAIIQETFLKPNTNFKLPGSTIFRKERTEGRKTGLFTLIKNGIRFSEANLISEIEHQAIKFISDKTEILLYNIYITPSKNFAEKDLEIFFASYTSTIICGDFNALSTLWSSPKNDKRGHIVENLITKYNLVVANTGSPTYQNWRGDETHIDITICTPSIALETN